SCVSMVITCFLQLFDALPSKLNCSAAPWARFQFHQNIQYSQFPSQASKRSKGHMFNSWAPSSAHSLSLLVTYPQWGFRICRNCIDV
uniref:Uncharacterized protein n=1 Tax=Pelusios castaneus TaxID=367368 RepID=A0A8C8SDM3_9SAUR